MHFSKAADELGITQPTLSQQIAKLEREIGVKLFERKTRSVKLTAAGEEFIVYAGKVLVELERLADVLKKHSAAKKSTYRFGVLANLEQLDLVKHIFSFQSLHPAINVRIIEKAGGYELLQLLQTGNLDATFLIASPELARDRQLVSYPLLGGRLVILAKKDHRLAVKTSISISDLEQERLIFPARNLTLYTDALNACRSYGFQPRIIGESNHTRSVNKLVAEGLGLALVSSQFAYSQLHPDIVILPLEPLIERNIYLAYLNPPSSSITTLFRDFILESFGVASIAGNSYFDRRV